MVGEINETPVIRTIFDRNEAQWGDSILIQEFRGKVSKFLDLDIECLRRYVEVTNGLSDLTINVCKPFKNVNLDILSAEITFNSIDDKIYEASVITGHLEGHQLANVITSNYIEGENLWELGGFDTPTRVKGDLQDYIASLCEYIERSLSYSIFDRKVSFYKQISPVNIKVVGLEEGVLRLVVTDIGSSIGKMIQTS